MIHHGDCREVMGTLDAESVDAIVTDPPYGLSFMGKGWDHGVPGVEFWTEALRVAKPGAHLLAFGGTRTYHRLACAIEDAGWEIRDCVMWVYGSGFPKSLDVSKAIDKAAGADREIVGEYVMPMDSTAPGRRPTQGLGYGSSSDDTTGRPLTAPATDAARQWSGWGTALKPAWEPVIVARKPLCGTVAENVLRHGTGGINVDGCRVEGPPSGLKPYTRGVDPRQSQAANHRDVTFTDHPSGRWPANVIHDGSDEVVGLFPVTKTGRQVPAASVTRSTSFMCGLHKQFPHAFAGDSGSAARFFYCAKASKADRDEGCEGLKAIHRANGNKWTDQDYRVTNGERPPSAESGPRRNHHPTVKPTDLMRYLCRLVTPPGGVVLDPFTGSGSTGKAAVLEGFEFIGIEREAEYVEIARARIDAAGVRWEVVE